MGAITISGVPETVGPGGRPPESGVNEARRDRGPSEPTL